MGRENKRNKVEIKEKWKERSMDRKRQDKSQRKRGEGEVAKDRDKFEIWLKSRKKERKKL